MKFHGLILDINGTLVNNHQLLGGALKLFAFLKESKTPYVLLSNDSTMTPVEWENVFSDLGLYVASDNILTSSVITAEFFDKNISKDKRIYLIGGYALESALTKKGYNITQNENYDVVLMGSDKKIDYKKISDGAIYINNGAKFFATNLDRIILSAGEVVPGNGALAKVLETATSVKPINIGKPSKFALDFAISKLKIHASEILILGDNPETDIAGASASGIKSVLLRTGLSNYISATVKPDYIFNNLTEFIANIHK